MGLWRQRIGQEHLPWVPFLSHQQKLSMSRRFSKRPYIYLPMQSTIQRKQDAQVGTKLLVIDSNDVLLKRLTISEALEIEPQNLPYGCGVHYVRNKIVYTRPGLLAFLDYCFQHFAVAIWSAQYEGSLDDTLRTVLHPCMVSKFLFIWGQEKTLVAPIEHPTIPQKPVFLKNLRLIWYFYPEFSGSNTLLVDDMFYKSYMNPRHLMICPKTFHPQTCRGSEFYLTQTLVPYLKCLRHAVDVPSFVATHPLHNPDDNESAEVLRALQMHYKNCGAHALSME